MTATPKFVCTQNQEDDYYSCTKDEICNDSKIFYKIDDSDPAYIGGYFD